MSIAVVCPSCAAKLQAPERAAGRKAKCPKCGTTLLVPKPGAQFAHQPPPPPSFTSSVATPAPGSLQLPEDFDFAARPDGSAPQGPGESPHQSVPPPIKQVEPWAEPPTPPFEFESHWWHRPSPVAAASHVIMRILLHLFGLFCIALGVLLGGLALFGDPELAVVFGLVALLLIIFGIRAYRHGGRQDSLVSAPVTKPRLSAPVTKPRQRRHTGLHYEDFSWGDPPPSRKQFGYAMSLGVEIRDGMTKWMLSDAIDEAIEQQRSGEPATKEQLRTIKKYHGVLPRAVTRGEAKRVIEFLEHYDLPCPFCGIEICATDEECCFCGKKLHKMKIPIRL